MTEEKIESKKFRLPKEIKIVLNALLMVGVLVFIGAYVWNVKLAPEQCWDRIALEAIRDMYNDRHATEDEVMELAMLATMPAENVDLGMKDGFRSCRHSHAFTIGPPKTTDNSLSSWSIVSMTGHRYVLVTYKISRLKTILEDVQELPE